MKSLPHVFIIPVMIFILFGCDSNNYQIVTGPDGSLYRFNKKTGELSMVMENKKIAKKLNLTEASDG